MCKHHHVRIPRFGQVTLGPVQAGALDEAHKQASDADPSDSPTVFANCVLSGMFVEPLLTQEDIEDLCAETLNQVVDAAIDTLGIRDHFADTPESIPIRERFSRAFLHYESEQGEETGAALGRGLRIPVGGINSSLGTVLSEFQRTISGVEGIADSFSWLSAIPRVVDFSYLDATLARWTRALDIANMIASIARPAIELEESWATQVRKLTTDLDQATRFAAVGLGAASLVTELMASLGTLDRFFQAVQAGTDEVEAFKAAGWPIAPSMPVELRQAVVAKHKQGRTRYASTTIMGYYRRKNHKLLAETVDSWGASPLFATRMHILQDALEAHRRGKYTLSVPALTLQIEGTLNDYVVSNGLVAKLGKVRQVYEAAIGDLGNYGFSRWVIASTLLYQLETNTYVSTDFGEEMRKAISRRQVTRHTIAHGVATNYDRPIHSLKAFLVLDAISAL